MAVEAATAANILRGDRIPPHSEEAEQGVLGSILLDSEKVMNLCIERQLVPESFYHPVYRTIYTALLEMSRQNRPIDLVTATEKLRSSGLLERSGGSLTLDRLVDSTPTAAHAEYYIDIVRHKHLLRCVIERARQAESLCYESEEPVGAIMSKVEQSFFDIEGQQHDAMRPWEQVVNGVMGYIEKIQTTRRGLAGIATGFRNLDNVLLGMRPSNMIILASRPSMGKTSLAMNIAEHVALGEGDPDRKAWPVGIFSLEMSCEDLVMRMICCRAQISSHVISRGFISNVNFRQLANAAGQLMRAPIYLDDAAGLDVVELRARARRMKKKYDVQLIVVDYLQLLHSADYVRHGRQVEISAVSGNLKAMAKELKVPVLVLSQLSRAPEARDTGVPRMADLRESGAIEQDADVIMLLRRPAVYPDDPEHDDETLAIVDVAKHRNGPPDNNIRLNFIKEFTLFQDRAEGVDGAPAAMGQEVVEE